MTCKQSQIPTKQRTTPETNILELSLVKTTPKEVLCRQAPKIEAVEENNMYNR